MLENACADAWPALTDQPLGQWRLRAAAGFTGRANGALAIGDPGTGVPRALKHACEFAHVHGIQPVAQVLDGSATERAVAAAGWVHHEGHQAGYEVSVLLGPAEQPGATGSGVGGVSVAETPCAPWWELVAGTASPGRAQRHVLAGGTAPVGFATARVGTETVGAARGTVVGSLLHVARLTVVATHRRRGLGTVLMNGLGRWAARYGATRCVLQVEANNTAALALYRGLGFTEHHRYRYWVPAKA
ncbi:acetyltransferase (GNAT) family protein [Amycolatopsis cihanbeyliensis]|uniref:Acetyltransferase (GNAT) family protein n=2 Tax=Amycolatopsis cihanbeyliensis TaxID=1128664 RepID=A0A542DNY6_AMYCI|nr:acetyltransferase (GNAT) family protein [Amycolatopsis cihanbeyliensis]